jgi:hypothetical protein
VEDRLAFWQRLHERLAKLSNRVDATAQAKILSDIHIRIPTVTLDEQRALQLRNAEADERFWSSVHDLNEEKVEGHKQLVATAERTIVEGQAEMAKAAEVRDTAKARRECLERGENVSGGLGKPLTREDVDRIFRQAGRTASDMRFAADLHEAASGVDFDMFVDAMIAYTSRAQSRLSMMRIMASRTNAATVVA